LLKKIVSWLGEKAGGTPKVRPAARPSVEPLEPRVLLSADLAGVQPVLSYEAIGVDQAVYADLDQQDTKGQEASSPILTLNVSPHEQASQTPTGQGDAPSSQWQQAQPGALEVELFGISPALFVENQGQWSDPTVRYVHDGDGVDVAMTDAGVVFRTVDANLQMLQFTASFIGAKAVRPVGLEQSNSLFNYYLGDQANWRQNVPSYEVVAYEGLYEGVDLRVQGLRSHVKYEFHVAAGADYRQIAVHYEGIEGLSIGEDGSLRVNLAAGRGVIRDNVPYIYQEIDGQRVTVAGRFILLESQTYSFEISGPIDSDHALVIDPDLAWSTYLGGSAHDIAVDTGGNVYVVGSTNSSGWTTGGFDTTYNGGYSDAFVVKLSSSGAHIWSTYLGGSSDDWGYGIAVDASGNVYATGHTISPGWTSGGFKTTYSGDDYFPDAAVPKGDAFVVKLNSAGNHLWSTYLGGSGGTEAGWGVGVDAFGDVYVGGITQSSGWTSGGFDTTYNGGEYDTFVAKLSSSGAHLWSTYLGGSGHDSGGSIAVDALGGIYVTGKTYSAGWTNGGLDTTYNGSIDAFVANLSSSGTHLWSTYLGGSEYDCGTDIAVDASSGVYVTGSTNSSGWTSGGFDTTYNGGTDAFVAKLSSSGTHLWNTYLGGTNYPDDGSGIGVDPSGNVYVTGSTQSRDWASGGGDTTYGGSTDAFVAKLTSSGTYLWSTYLGGGAYDSADGVAADALGNVHVTGPTDSSGWISGGFDTTYDTGDAGFVAKITGDPDTTSPSQPACILPVEGATGVNLTPTLESSDFSDPNVGDTHVASRWQVDDSSDFSIPLWDYEDTDSDKTSQAVPIGTLLYNTTYYWRVRYQDSQGAWSESSASGSFTTASTGSEPSPVFRFYSPVYSAHLYTMDAAERDDLIGNHADVWTYEGIAYRAFAEASRADAVPVYRFWSQSLGKSFYTIKQSERDKLVNNYSDVYTYEGVAFYVLSSYADTSGASPVYRLWSGTRNSHFWTISAVERDRFVRAGDWTYEGVAWYGVRGAPLVAVDWQRSLDASPQITGTVDDAAAAIEVTVGGQTYAPVNHGDGTWTLANDQIAPALADGIYDVVVRATDSSGRIGTDMTTNELTIDAAVPIVAAGADQSQDEGCTVNLIGASFSDASPVNMHTAMIDWGDGRSPVPGVVDQVTHTINSSHVYADNGVFTVTIAVTDDDGLSGTDTCTVTVSNVAPTVQAGADRTITQGWPIHLAAAQYNDLGTLDTHTATIDWGDGTSPDSGERSETPFGPPGDISGMAGTVNGSHIYTAAGIYSVVVTVIDDDGGLGQDTFVVTVRDDIDADGIASTEEQGPAGQDGSYDGNGDGTPDAQQSNVASFHTVTDDYVTLGCSAGMSLSSVAGIANPSPENVPQAVQMLYGSFAFRVNGVSPASTATVTLFLPAGTTANAYYKYGPTPDNPNEHWYAFMYNGQTGAQISGNVVTLHLVDGLRGDDDLSANGAIVDSGGPALVGQAGCSPVYRFWKASDNTHFFTIKESEKQKLIDNYSNIYTYESVAYYAYVKDQPPAGTLPVYRFWKPSDDTHFFTIKESEKDKLITLFSHVYRYEGIAYYAYTIGQQPVGTLPVYRFWKSADNTHFFTIKESEKDKLVNLYSQVFTFEGIGWYAYVG